MDGCVKIWDTNAFEAAAEFKVGDIINVAKANTTGSMIAAGMDTSEIAIVDPLSGGDIFPQIHYIYM
jgi:hypothetical protein